VLDEAPYNHVVKAFKELLMDPVFDGFYAEGEVGSAVQEVRQSPPFLPSSLVSAIDIHVLILLICLRRVANGRCACRYFT
jgi:hypothetical protein